jgi:hypothetical protein
MKSTSSKVSQSPNPTPIDIRGKTCRRRGVHDANDVINREAAICWDGD